MRQKLLNVILTNLTVFFALISIHEISHLVMGTCLGCVYGRAVLLDSKFNGPYSEIACSGEINQFLLYISSFILTTSFGLLFLLLRSPEKNMFFIIFGLSLIFSSLDISIVTGIQSLFYPLVSLGFIFMGIGEYFIASFYIKKEMPYKESLLY